MKQFLICIIFTCIGNLGKGQPHIGLNIGFIGDTGGYYYLKCDSSFIFCGAKFINPSKPRNWKLDFNDTITSCGIGKWYVQDSFVIFKFFKFPSVILNKNDINYSSFSRQPYDSLFLNIDVIDTSTRGKTLVIAYNANNKANVSDNPNKINLVLPISFADSSILIVHGDEERQLITLSPGNNVHNLRIRFSNSPEFQILSELSLSTRTRTAFRYDRFRKIDGNIERLKAILEKNILAYPERKNVFNILLQEVNNRQVEVLVRNPSEIKP